MTSSGHTPQSLDLRSRLVSVALEWEAAYGVAPAVTGCLAEYDAARLVGLADADFRRAVGGASAVRKGYDFEWGGQRYQVKANRPSGRRGSAVTLVAKASNFDFDLLVWLLYDRTYTVQEAWQFDVADYRSRFEGSRRVRPPDMRMGRKLFPAG